MIRISLTSKAEVHCVGRINDWVVLSLRNECCAAVSDLLDGQRLNILGTDLCCTSSLSGPLPKDREARSDLADLFDCGHGAQTKSHYSQTEEATCAVPKLDPMLRPSVRCASCVV